jgi:transcriptional regulator PpsR
VTGFIASDHALGEVDAETAVRLITTAADVTLVLDGEGVIRDVAFGSDELSKEGYQHWLGQPWALTVTVESRPKVEALLRDAAQSPKSVPTWRQLNHPSPQGNDVPILYSAIRVGSEGRVVAVGRNLRAVSALQQRLVEAQQSLERDYARLRHVEARFRLLFQMSSEAILIIDALSQKVVEANPAATEILSGGAKHVVGRHFPNDFGGERSQAVQALLATARSAGRADDVRVQLGDGGRDFLITASLFRQDNASHFLIRLTPARADGGSVLSKAKVSLLRVLEHSPDGFVLTEPDGRILSANRAFLDFIQVASEEQARGRSLDQWFARPGVDLNVLIGNLKQHGAVRLFATTLRGELGSSSEVEVSGVAVPEGDPPCLGFTIRGVGRRLAAVPRAGRELPRSVEQLTELIGRVPLKEIVRETTDVIERLCIESALQLTGDNRASAAEMLGLSRQSLYVKLHRYGLGDLGE